MSDPWWFAYAVPVLQLGTGTATNKAALGRWDQSHWDKPLTGTWTGLEPAWQDVDLCNLLDVTITRGRDRWLDRFGASTGSFTLRDPDGRLSWDSSDTDDMLEIRPGREVRLVARHVASGVEYPIWRGWIESINDTFAPAADPVASFNAQDGYAQLAHINLPEIAPAGAGESSDARVTRLLDAAEWPDEWRDLDAGVITVQATNLARPIADDLGITADSEGGAIYADREGRIVFRNRDWLRTDPHVQQPQAVLGDDTADTGVQYFYTWSNLASLPTAAGQIRSNVPGLPPDQTTGLAFADLDVSGVNRRGALAAVPVGSTIDLSTTTGGRFALYHVTTVQTGNTGYIRYVFTLGTSSGTAFPPNGAAVTATIYPPGATPALGICAAGYETVRDAGDIVNDVQLARAGGTVQRYTNETSISLYRHRSYSRTDYVCEDDAQVSLLAQRILSARSGGQVRVPKVSVTPTDDPRAWAFVLAVDYGWRLELHYGTDWVRDVLVQGVSHKLNPDGWETELRVDDMAATAADSWDGPRGWDRAVWAEVF